MKHSSIAMVTFNLYPAKMGMGLFAGFLSLCTENLFPLFVTVIVFEFIDFVTGVIKSGVVNKRKGQPFAFESVKAWRTIYKFVFILIGIVLAELLDHTLAEEAVCVWPITLPLSAAVWSSGHSWKMRRSYQIIRCSAGSGSL